MTVSSKSLRSAAALLALLLASVARAGPEAVKVSSKPEVGRYLTDARGMSLYVFKKDSPGKSACAGDCLAKWPPYHPEQVAAPGDLKASDFGAITREDGQKQTTYKGLPLYYFAGDREPSDTKGQGVKDVWSLAAP